jgi:hypothetical protein
MISTVRHAEQLAVQQIYVPASITDIILVIYFLPVMPDYSLFSFFPVYDLGISRSPVQIRCVNTSRTGNEGEQRYIFRYKDERIKIHVVEKHQRRKRDQTILDMVSLIGIYEIFTALTFVSLAALSRMSGLHIVSFRSRVSVLSYRWRSSMASRVV